MVFSASTEPELLMRCMRAGAREFLQAGGFTATLGEALTRAAVRRAEAASYARKTGKLLVFWGAKGGVGVSTVASNFALTLRKEAAADVALVDLNLQLGGIAVLLGFTPQFTILDALRHSDRLDHEFVSTLMTPHESGISVLASSDEYRPSIPITNGTVGKVLHILRERYGYVVVDAGPGLGSSADELFETADRNYVITQLDIPSLRNAQRFLAHHRHANQQSLEVVLNRFEPRKLEYDEERIARALGVAPRWKIPNDYPGVRRSQDTGSPLPPAHSPVARGIAECTGGLRQTRRPEGKEG
jgi:pilus assembly protein CpaE